MALTCPWRSRRQHHAPRSSEIVSVSTCLATKLQADLTPYLHVFRPRIPNIELDRIPRAGVEPTRPDLLTVMQQESSHTAGRCGFRQFGDNPKRSRFSGEVLART